MPTNHLLRSIRAGRPVVGFAHSIRDEALSETFRTADVDFVLVDLQHVAIGLETLQRTLIALQPSEVAVLVRPPANDAVVVGQIFDLGATGVIVPMVNTPDDARRAVAAAKYPPDGTRSWGPRRLAMYHHDPAAYPNEANDDAVVIVQIETSEAVQNLDAILAVSGLAGVMVGPSDLAISLGYSHDRQNSAVLDTIQFVLDRSRAAGVPFGFFAATPELGMHWLRRGALIVNCSSDTSFIAQGIASLSADVAATRERVDGTPSADG